MELVLSLYPGADFEKVTENRLFMNIREKARLTVEALRITSGIDYLLAFDVVFSALKDESIDCAQIVEDLGFLELADTIRNARFAADQTRYINLVIICPNNMVIVFDQNDEQMPEYQGLYDLVIHRIRDEAGPGVRIEDYRRNHPWDYHP